jgi:RNA polymerase sigma-70 factor (ECF subfamily)
MSDPETWVDQFGDYLYNFALSRIQNPSVAEDVVQETFLAALRDSGNFKGLSSERTWLTSILKHKIIDHFRKVSREQPVDDMDFATDLSDDLFDEKGIRLREMDGLNCDEICNVLKITPSNCWVMLYRARMSIRRCLEVKWFDTEAGEGS